MLYALSLIKSVSDFFPLVILFRLKYLLGFNKPDLEGISASNFHHHEDVNVITKCAEGSELSHSTIMIMSACLIIPQNKKLDHVGIKIIYINSIYVAVSFRMYAPLEVRDGGG